MIFLSDVAARSAATGIVMALLGTAGCAHHSPAPAATPERAVPRVVVVLTVDQMAAPYFERFGTQFTGGFARLLRDGAVFTNAFQDHGVTETAPGHSVVLSGRYPYSTGIVRNSEGVGDSTAPLLHATGQGASPARFHGTEFFDWLRARWPAARMVSVSRKDRGAILPVGRSRNNVQVYWFDSGIFTTSRWYADTLPDWVRRFDGGLPAIDRSTPLQDVPQLDSLELQLALLGSREDSIGMRDGTPDVLAVSLSALDAVGHAYGPESPQVHDLLFRLDGWLGTFFDSLDVRYGREGWVVALTADHGVTPRPEVSRSHGIAADFVNVDSVIGLERDALVARLGPGMWIPWREVGMVALDRAHLASRGVNVDSVAADLAAKLRALPGVAEVDTRAVLAHADTSDISALRWKRMLSPTSQGEVFVTLVAPNYFGHPRITEHGQATDADAHVVFAVAGPGVRPGRYAQRIGVVDLAPTLAALLGVRPLERVDGHPLTAILQ